MTHAPKIAAQKKQPILRDNKYPYQTALTLLNPDIVHKIMQQLQKNKKNHSKKKSQKKKSQKLGFQSASLPPCLTTFASLEAKRRNAWPPNFATITNSPVRSAFCRVSKVKIQSLNCNKITALTVNLTKRSRNPPILYSQTKDASRST